MTWRKALAVDVGVVLLASGLLVVIVRPWLAQRQQASWPAATATVTGYKQGPGFKGRSATYLQGHYALGARTQEFQAVWGPSDLTSTSDGSNAWVPPRDIPAPGSTVAVRVDPARPSLVVIQEQPASVTMAGTLGAAAVVLFLALAFGIGIWFV